MFYQDVEKKRGGGGGKGEGGRRSGELQLTFRAPRPEKKSLGITDTDEGFQNSWNHNKDDVFKEPGNN